MDIIKTALDESGKMVGEMTIEHNKQELISINQPGSVQIVRGYVVGVGADISSAYDAAEGWDIDDYTLKVRIENIRSLVNFLSTETQEGVSQGDVLLLGPGRHIHEVLMLMQVFPNLRSLHVVDSEMRNLLEIKEQLDSHSGIDKDKIKLYHANFDQLPFEDGKFTICYSRSVIDESLHLGDEVLDTWVSELKRVLKQEGKGIYLTLGSDGQIFKNRGFILRSLNYERFFIACFDRNVFNHPSLRLVVGADQQIGSSL